MTPDRPPKTFAGLDALRGVAAVAVLSYHLAGQLGSSWLAPSGYLAVDLFFLMSGFVVAHAYERKIPEIGVLGFMRVRITRFLPLFYLGGLLGIARLGILAVLSASDVGPTGVLAYFLFLPAPGPSAASVSPINFPAWSLLFEIYINLLYALLLPRLRDSALAVIVGLSGAGLLAAALMGVPLSGGAIWGSWWVGILRVCFSFPLGVLLYRRGAWRSARSWTKMPLLLIFCAAVSIPSRPLWDAAFVLLLSPALLLLAIRSGREDRIARYGAAGSYATYAIHWPIIVVVGAAARRIGLEPRAALLAAAAGIIVVAPLLDRLFDRPARRWLNSLNPRPASPAKG